MRLYEGDTADDAWRLAHDDVCQWSSQTSRNGPTRETLRAIFLIRNPRRRWVFSRIPPISPALAIAEIAWILAGDDRLSYLLPWNKTHSKFVGPSEHVYGSYGRRLRESFGVDQLRRAGQALRSAPDSRQVVLQLYDPALDLPSEDGSARSGDVPCNVTSLLKIRDGRLEWTQILRSNDLYRGVPYNFVQFTTLQEVVAGLAEVEVGTYAHLSDSLHAYEHDVKMGATTLPRLNLSLEDDLRLSLGRFDATIAEFHAAIELVSGSECTALLDSAVGTGLPTGWANLLFVCASEKARRNGDLDAASAYLEACTNYDIRMLQQQYATSRRLRDVETGV